MQSNKNAVIYLVKAPDSRQNEVISTFMQTFSINYTCDVSRYRFPVGTLYCYVLINDTQNTATLVIQNSPTNEPIDVELAIYQDIISIPLMHPAIKASKI